MSHSSLAAMSRIRKPKRALKRGRAQVTVESARVTGETIITAGMSPEHEAEVRKQYYRDHEPAAPAFKPTTEELRAGLQQARSTLAVALLRGDKSPEWIAEVKAVIAALYKELGDLAPEGEADYRDHEAKPAAPAAVDDLTPEYLEKLRHDCLVAANAHLRGRSAEEIVAEAARDLELRLRFLRGQSQ